MLLGLYRVFRGAVTLAVWAIAAALVFGVAIDFIDDRGILEGWVGRFDPDWNPLTVVELIPGFWPSLMLGIGLALGMALDASASRPRPKRTKSGPLEIVFDPNDHRFVYRDFPNGQLKPVTRFNIGIHNTTGERLLQDIIVSAGRSAFVKTMVEPAWGGRTRRIARIEPNATEFVEILGLPDDPAAAADIGGKAHRFVIRASASDTRRTSAKFEFNVHAASMIRRVS
jgi:hypothetical protein